MDILNQTCNGSVFSKTDFNTVYYFKIVVSSLAVIACVLAILVIVCYRGYKRFVYRLVLYFMITVLCQALSLILELLPIVHKGTQVLLKSEWDIPCAVSAFFDQVTHWTGNLLVLWMMVYLLSLAWRVYYPQETQNGGSHQTNQQKVSKAELVALFGTLVVPLLINWIPFSTNMYGLSGMWCWIKETKTFCSQDIQLGLVFMFTLYYGPLILLMLFSLVSLLVIVTALCKRWMTVHGMVRQQYMRGIREIALIMIYPILYNLICILLVANRIDSAVRTNHGEKPFYPLWLAHALADSFCELLPPLAFLLHPSTWKNLVCVREKEEDTEYFYVPPEDSDIDEGITIRGSAKPVNYGSIFQN